MQLNHTHDPVAESWLPSAQGSDFPIQNLPFALFRQKDKGQAWRGGVAIGEQIVDLPALAASGLLNGAALAAVNAAHGPALNPLLASGPRAWRALRHALFDLLNADARASAVDAVLACLVPQATAEFAVPTQIGDYTDFFTSFDHALSGARMANPDGDVSPNFRWLPIGYHGRASTVGVSGQSFHRPWGQSKMPWEPAPPHYRPTQWLDYELEIAAWVGQGNTPGVPVPLAQAEQHIFGLGLLNDWSARDLQIWEMAPLGPFLSKSFATTVSPWIVTMEALAPYRAAWQRGVSEPAPLAYLDTPANRESGGIDIQLEVWLETAQARQQGSGPSRLSHTSFKHQYWTVAQMLTHHTSAGCNLNPGDLLGSGTISGPVPEQAGSLLELSNAARQPLTLANGQQRTFVEDGDAVILRGWCEAPGRPRIGFGECRGLVMPAIAAPHLEADKETSHA